MRTFNTRLAALLLAAAAPLHADQLSDPAPIAVPAGITAADLDKSIARALAARGWVAGPGAPGRVVAAFDHLGSVARVAIAWDSQAVRITYRDSTDLDYEENGGQREIDGQYNKWVQALADEIARFDAGPRPRIAQSNPPPSEKFSAFSGFELRPVAIDQRYNGGVNLKVQRKLENLLQGQLEPLLAGWRARAGAGARRTLVIEPRIDSVRFVSGAIRYMVHSMAGHSSIALSLNCTDAASGAVIANPRFYRVVGDDMSGGPFDAGEDNRMLDDVVRLARLYMLDNYDAFAGGPSGDPPPAQNAAASP